jgi:hypothetical protein
MYDREHSTAKGHQMNLLDIFFAGIFICNCIPHLTAGLQGKSFPTPFGKPRGVGNSSALINVIWGLFNLLIGLLLLSRHPLIVITDLGLVAFIAGMLVIGIYLALHFSKIGERTDRK